MKKEKKRPRGYPDDQQKGAGRHSQHDERAEMMILRLLSQLEFLLTIILSKTGFDESRVIPCMSGSELPH